MAVIVTNLPVLFPLFKMWLGPFFRSSIRLLSHPGWPNGSLGEKDLEEQAGSGGINDTRYQGYRTLFPISHTSRRRAGNGMGSIRFSRMAGPYGTPARTFDVRSGGSGADRAVEDDESCHGSIHSGGRDWGHEDGAALNCTESQGSDAIITPVPPCKIRKVVEVSVEEGEPTSLSFGNFTSAWGPKRKPPGPDLPLDMRTPYLADHLQPVAHGTKNWESSCMRRLMG